MTEHHRCDLRRHDIVGPRDPHNVAHATQIQNDTLRHFLQTPPGFMRNDGNVMIVRALPNRRGGEAT